MSKITGVDAETNEEWFVQVDVDRFREKSNFCVCLVIKDGERGEALVEISPAKAMDLSELLINVANQCLKTQTEWEKVYGKIE